MILKLIQKTAREANSEFVIATNSVIAYFYDPGLRHLTLYTAYQAFKFTDADLSHLNWDEFVDSIKKRLWGIKVKKRYLTQKALNNLIEGFLFAIALKNVWRCGVEWGMMFELIYGNFMILMENTWLTKQQVAFNSKDRDLIETCLKNNLVVEVVCQKKSNRLIICFSAAYKEVEASHVKLTSFPDGDDEILWSELIYPSVEVQKRVKKYMMSYN